MVDANFVCECGSVLVNECCERGKLKVIAAGVNIRPFCGLYK